MASPTLGSFRLRARISERATVKGHEEKRTQARVQTQLALAKFEEHLATQDAAQFELYDDLDEASALQAATRSSASRSRGRTESGIFRDSRGLSHTDPLETPAQRSLSEARLPSPSPHAKRPPSPLSMYDYGCVSLKPRSTFAQHRHRHGETTRPEHRSTSCGFYFPGPNYERGPYGFSMLDPVLMPPRHWVLSPQAPDRWRGDAADSRPSAVQELAVGRDRASGPVGSPQVRMTAAHTARSKLAFQHLDKRREEAVLEQARFENGVYEGRWRDPLLDRNGELPEASPAEEHSWVSMPVEDLKPAQVKALKILYGIDTAVKQSMGRFADLFAAENSGPRGVLEVHEFLHGLLRLSVVSEGELAPDDLREIMSHVDPAFDGRVNLPVIARAIAAVRRMKEPPPPKFSGEQSLQDWRASVAEMRAKKDGQTYGEAAPVEVIRLNYKAGLYNFGKSFEKFRAQQKALLGHHAELT